MTSSRTSTSGASAVFTGFWIDHDEGRFRGAMLTLSNRNAAVLLSFLAVIVTFAGNRSWKIWRFAFYQCLCVTHEPESIARAKRQIKAVLRNVLTAGSTLWTFVELLWASRRRQAAHIYDWKSVSLTVFSAIHLAVFVAAGILTSRILVGNNVVSRVVDSCGIWIPQDTTDEGLRAGQSLRQNETLEAESLVRNCYDQVDSRGILDCGKLYTQFLPYQVYHDSECPFKDNLCISSAYTMDSGLIRFNDLGINSQYSKSLSVQRQSTCAVIPDEPFVETIYSADDLPLTLSGNETIVSYAFNSLDGTNASQWYRDDLFSATYNLRSYHIISDPTDIVEPLRPEEPKDHDLSLILLRSNGVRFSAEQDDPWFSVHNLLSFDNSTGDISPDTIQYTTDRFLNIIACDERVRFCSNITGACTKWSGLYEPLANISIPLATLGGPSIPTGSDAYLEFMKTNILVALNVLYTSIPNAIQGRDASTALQASRFVNMGEQYYLAPEQWKLELNFWFSMVLARLQLDIFSTIEKPPGLDASRALNLFEENDLKNVCGRIKFYSPNHATLSTLGIAIVLVLVSLLTLGSFVDVVLGWLPWEWAKRTVLDWERLENLGLLFELEAWWARVEEFSDPFEVTDEPK